MNVQHGPTRFYLSIRVLGSLSSRVSIVPRIGVIHDSSITSSITYRRKPFCIVEESNNKRMDILSDYCSQSFSSKVSLYRFSYSGTIPSGVYFLRTFCLAFLPNSSCRLGSCKILREYSASASASPTSIR